MGQLAAENLDDIRLMYKRMARDVWVNMKEREHSLEDARKKAEDVWEYAKSLVRIEVRYREYFIRISEKDFAFAYS